MKKLKDEKANDIDVARAVAELKARKNALDNKVNSVKIRIKGPRYFSFFNSDHLGSYKICVEFNSAS